MVWNCSVWGDSDYFNSILTFSNVFTAKKHSFGKSTPPPKPKPPSFSHKGSSGSLNDSKESTKEVLKEQLNEKNHENNIKHKSEKNDLDLDTVLRSDDKLAHLTAERVKAPKRRPPSSVFQKEAVSFNNTIYTQGHSKQTETF